MFCELKCLEMTTFHSIQLHLPSAFPYVTFLNHKTLFRPYGSENNGLQWKDQGTHAHIQYLKQRLDIK